VDTTFETSFIYFYYCQLTKVFPVTAAEGLAVDSGIARTTTASTT
jgi:hypothetical protein